MLDLPASLPRDVEAVVVFLNPPDDLPASLRSLEACEPAFGNPLDAGFAVSVPEVVVGLSVGLLAVACAFGVAAAAPWLGDPLAAPDCTFAPDFAAVAWAAPPVGGTLLARAVAPDDAVAAALDGLVGAAEDFSAALAADEGVDVAGASDLISFAFRSSVAVGRLVF